MYETREVARRTSMDAARVELLAEAMEEIQTRARRYIQEPADDGWHDLVRALTHAHGDTATYDLLHAIEIHVLTSRPR